MSGERRGGFRIWVGILAIFVFGAITGVLGAAFYVHHHVIGRMHSRGPLAFEDVAVELLDWRLDLSQEQERAVAEIVRDTHLDLMHFKLEHSEEIDAMLGTGLERIEATLDERQLEVWESLRARIEAAHRVPGE